MNHFAIRRIGRYGAPEYLTPTMLPGTYNEPEWSPLIPRIRWYTDLRVAAEVADRVGGEVVDATLSPVGVGR